MAETRVTNPAALARQTREDAIRKAEEKYKNDLVAAARARESAIHKATAVKAEALNQARAALDFPKKRLSESRDRIEAGLRKRELDAARRTQEQFLIKAEDARVKSLKLADALGKRLAAEAAGTRRLSIRQAYENEKQMKLEAEQASKIQKEDARSRTEEERKSRERIRLEAVDAKTRAQKSAAAERSAREALSRNGEKTPKKEIKPEKVYAEPVQQAPVMKLSTPDKESGEKPAGRAKSDKPGSSVSRQGMIKLIIVHKDADSCHMVDFEKNLRNITDIRLVMVGGTTNEGAQIIVNAEKAVAMSEMLRQLPVVEEVNDRHDDILIKLKPVVIFQNNI